MKAIAMAFLGTLGTQRAEFMALIHGIHAVLAYARTTNEPLDRVVLSVDNKTVALTMNSVWTARELAPYHQAATVAVDQLRATGAEVVIQKVSEKDVHHRKAHRLSKGAWNQVLFDQSWRPKPARPPKNAR